MNAPQETGGSRPLALVTGSSSGIGYELARQLGERGYDIVITGDDADETVEAARRIEAGTRAETFPLASDLSTKDGVEKLFVHAQGLGRPIALLCANAGAGDYGEFAETPLSDDLRVIDLNVAGQVHMMKLAVLHMQNHGGGRILITSSLVSLAPNPRLAIYAATKAFLRSFGEAIRNELADDGINVTVLMPGATDTGFFKEASMEGTKVAEGRLDDPADVARQALDALEKDQDRVVTGVKNKAMAAAIGLVPDRVKAKVTKNQVEPKHH